MRLSAFNHTFFDFLLRLKENRSNCRFERRRRTYVLRDLKNGELGDFIQSVILYSLPYYLYFPAHQHDNNTAVIHHKYTLPDFPQSG